VSYEKDLGFKACGVVEDEINKARILTQGPVPTRRSRRKATWQRREKGRGHQTLVHADKEQKKKRATKNRVGGSRGYIQVLGELPGKVENSVAGNSSLRH